MKWLVTGGKAPGEISRRSFFRAAAGAAAWAGWPWRIPAEIQKIEFSFIQLSDTHVSRQRLVSERQGYDVAAEESIRRCRAAVKDINECTLPHELIVHTGDVAHTRETNEDFDLALELLQFKKKAYYVPGNHDLGYSETDKHRPAFEKRFGPSNQAVEPVAGLRLAFFDSQPMDVRASAEHRERALRQLERILTPRKPTILFCHVMGIPSFHLNQLHEGWPEELMQRWTERMKQGGVFAVMAGHLHRNEQHVINGVPFYLTEPVINFWGRQTAYRHWRLAGGVLTYRTVYLEL